MDNINQLTPTTTGRWIVHTNGSTHHFDLDHNTYKRTPGPRSGSGHMDHDNQEVHLTRIEIWPKIGSRFRIWFDDPNTPHLTEHWRHSSTIRHIEPDPHPRAT